MWRSLPCHCLEDKQAVEKGNGNGNRHGERQLGGCKPRLSNPVECLDPTTKGSLLQTRFRTVPADEFVDGMTVLLLRTGRCERVKHSNFRLLQVGQAKYCFSSTCQV